ncbi:MAG: hypothetical protein B6I28_02235 [Fusobacteriia bacterium 4572_132]|nr:MAG: hypothetical protein B6I28_02235 [Fusobacteriia bacterium 4572_132]
MKKKIIMIFLGLLITVSTYAEIELKEIEKNFFGFSLENIKSEKERIGILEKKIIGHISDGILGERKNKLYELLYNNSKYKSLTLKLSEIEKKILKKQSMENILTRLENLELIAYGKINNNDAFIDRIKKISKYFGMEEKNVY